MSSKDTCLISSDLSLAVRSLMMLVKGQNINTFMLFRRLLAIIHL